MWPAFPVSWFGNIEGKQVAVATIGLNPSWSEFVSEGKIERDAETPRYFLQSFGAIATHRRNLFITLHQTAVRRILPTGG